MKALKYFLILGLLATGFVSCKEDDDDTEQIKNLDDIPKGKAKLNLDGVYLLFPAVEYAFGWIGNLGRDESEKKN